jgi:hypothetical protein
MRGDSFDADPLLLHRLKCLLNHGGALLSHHLPQFADLHGHEHRVIGAARRAAHRFAFGASFILSSSRISSSLRRMAVRTTIARWASGAPMPCRPAR